MAATKLDQLRVYFQEYFKIVFTSRTFIADNTYEKCVYFDNVDDDYIFLVKAVGSTVTVKLTWEVELEGTHTEEIAISDGEIYAFGPFGTRFSTQPVVEAKIATASGNSAEFALLGVTWFKGTGIR